MDSEELHRLLKQVQVQYQLLEADKEVEASRAARYRTIALDALAGDDSPGTTQPEISRVLHADRSALPRPTLLVVTVGFPISIMGMYLYLPGHVMS